VCVAPQGVLGFVFQCDLQLLQCGLIASGDTAAAQPHTWGRGAIWPATARHFSWHIRRPALIEASSPDRWKGNLPRGMTRFSVQAVAHSTSMQTVGGKAVGRHMVVCSRAASAEISMQHKRVQQRDCV